MIDEKATTAIISTLGLRISDLEHDLRTRYAHIKSYGKYNKELKLKVDELISDNISLKEEIEELLNELDDKEKLNTTLMGIVKNFKSKLRGVDWSGKDKDSVTAEVLLSRDDLLAMEGFFSQPNDIKVGDVVKIKVLPNSGCSLKNLKDGDIAKVFDLIKDNENRVAIIIMATGDEVGSRWHINPAHLVKLETKIPTGGESNETS